MRPALLPLEPRDCPSVYDAGGGVMHFGTGREVQPFSDYTGLLDSLTRADGTTVVVPSPFEAATPGGPRVAEFDADGNRIKADYWAGDPASRAGVILVDTGGTVTQPPLSPPPPATFNVPDEVRGDPAAPGTWVIDLRFDAPSSPEWVEGVIDEAWRIEQPLGNVAIVTRAPNDYPGNYGTVIVGMDLSFAQAQGDTVVRWDEPRPNWLSDGVYVDGRPLDGRPQPAANVGQVVAHEIGHALGLSHDTTPGSVMQYGVIEPGLSYTPQDVLTARAAAAKAVALEYRPGPAATQAGTS